MSGVAFAQDAEPISIPSQSLATALNSFGVQTGRAVMFKPELAAGKQSRAVDAAADPELALNELLSGTGLSWRRQGDLFMIVESTDPQSGSAAGDGAEGTVDTLVVTAQKREEDIQDVPIAISAFTQEDLTRSQVAGGPDLITQVPNMTFTKTNFSSYSVQLRGIGTQAISATTDPAVAVAFNNTPFIRNRFFEQEFYDLQRVEVLRGPQGTLYGRNATAGVVNIISQKPKFIAEAKASGDVSNYSSSRLEGMVNIPLVEDRVALRMAGAWTKREGYSVNELTGNPIDGRDLWSTRVSLRVSPNDRLDANLIWEHFEENDDRLRSGKQLCKKDIVTEVLADGLGPNGVGIDVTGIDYFAPLPDRGQGGGDWAGVQGVMSQGCERNSLYGKDSFQTPTGLMLPYYRPLGSIGLPAALPDPYVSAVQSPDLRAIESTIDPIYRAEADIGELQISFDLTDTLTLSSETSYGVDTVYSMQDFNRFNTAPGAWGGDPDELAEMIAREVLRTDLGPNLTFCDPQLGCSDRLVAVDVSTATSSQFSQEFRLASDYEGPFNFSLGFNYLRGDSEDKYYVFINSLSLIAQNGNNATYGGPYVPGETDNSECLIQGYAPGQFDRVYPVTHCVYFDPNSLESVNDKGHNYFLSKNPYKLISYAVFGEAYYQLAENLKITAGLRWTVDKKDAPRVPTWILAGDSVGYPVAEVIEQEWREPTGRIALDWKPDLSLTDDTMIYGSYAHGYKAGGANPPGYVRVYYADPNEALGDALESETRPRTFDPEFVDAFELGAKNTLADGKVTLNLSAFYYDYKDYQISEIVDRSAFNRNFDATVWGMEVESDWRPLENLRLGFKVGYQEAEIADGERAIDLMDRTAGDPSWILVRPFPTYASSCILPVWLYAHERPDVFGLMGLGGPSGGHPGGCELAYIQGVDPVTALPHVPNPTVELGGISSLGNWVAGSYAGWDPTTAPNGGEGITKPLSGNELPNAPNLTATITADYTIPLPNEWLATLHTDLHWQGESDWRIFQDHEYSKLDEYFTMNLAAIFTNEDAGWTVMAYVKNVTDETAITGAFLNSDDTGLTTNVFLTEPRLYGLRVTKEWTGGRIFTPFNMSREGPYPVILEFGGQVQRHDAGTAFLEPTFNDDFTGPLALFDDAQDADLDWGDGREVKLTWRPGEAPWSLSASLRYGKINGTAVPDAQVETDTVCVYNVPAVCQYLLTVPKYTNYVYTSMTDHADATIYDREEHRLADFAVGRDMGMGRLNRSTVSLGLRYATLESTTAGNMRGTPDWVIDDGFAVPGMAVTHTVYDSWVSAVREFSGVGPIVSWEAAYPVASFDSGSRLDIDWSLWAGMMFGDRDAVVTMRERARFYSTSNPTTVLGLTEAPLPYLTTTVPEQTWRRSDDATVITHGASLGLSYAAGGFSAGVGYRWERYKDAIDSGFMEAEDADRTIDGPYFKLSVGFGG